MVYEVKLLGFFPQKSEMERAFIQGLKMCIVLLFLSSLDVVTQLVDGAATDDKKDGLYSKLKDDVIVLNLNNMRDRVYGKNIVWVIEFYNSWCGHCIEFAPTWKQFASDLKGWRRVVSVGAVDCANDDNVKICRDFDIQLYPSVLILPPQFGDDKMNKLTQVKTRSTAEIKETVLDYITNPELSIPKTWPQLTPLQSLGDIWNGAKEEHDFVVVVFEDKNSIVGRQVILDLVDYGTIHVRTMLKENVQKFGILKYPSLYIINKDSSFQHLASGTGMADSDRHRFVDKLLSMLGLFDSEGRRIKISHNNEEKEKPGNVVQFELPREVDTKASSIGVHMLDLESALHYAFRQEIAICKTIDGSKLNALHDFITSLAKYFPGRKEVSRFLWKLVEYLRNLHSPLSGESWNTVIDNLQDNEAFIPFQVKWVGCQGSHPRYRGYPCGMWTLFHTLTVAAYLNSTESTTVKSLEVPLAIRGYMEHFFGCHECSENFLKMAATLESDIHTPEEAVTWLWAAHNKANKRLYGGPSEDPQHPKIQFPSEKDCPGCRMKVANKIPVAQPVSSWDWSQTAVVNFLVKLYGPEGIIQDVVWQAGDEGDGYGQGREIAATKSKDEMDWWENKQRQEDLKKIRQLHEQKRKTKLERNLQKLHNLTVRVSREEQAWNLGRETESRRKADYAYEERTVMHRWGFSQLDIGVCMAFYVVCAIIILYLYYHFIVHKKFKAPCSKCLPV